MLKLQVQNIRKFQHRHLAYTVCFIAHSNKLKPNGQEVGENSFIDVIKTWKEKNKKKKILETMITEKKVYLHTRGQKCAIEKLTAIKLTFCFSAMIKIAEWAKLGN